MNLPLLRWMKERLLDLDINLVKKTERLDGVHVPCIVSNAKRRKCVFHPKIKTRYECETCQVPLCLTDAEGESCWYKFHYEEEWEEI